MISTGRTGRAVAVVSGGSQDGTVIRIATECDAEVPKRHMHDVLDEGDLLIDPRKFKLLSLEDQTLIMEALERGDLDEDEGDEDDSEEEKPYQPLRGPQRRVAKTYAEKSKYEYRVNDGRMVVLPSKETERVFVAGMSGSGKSCFTASYMLEYSDMFPDRRIILFSTHEDEKAYRAIEHTPVALDDDFADNPPSLDDLTDTLCVFDDCDNLQNKRISTAIEKLNADLVCNGRKHNIHVVTLAHQLMDYKKTRVQLNEANRVVFFPQGSAYHNQRYLKTYAGLAGNWIKKILAERSRWICLDLRLPKSYVTENAVVIIRDQPEQAS